MKNEIAIVICNYNKKDYVKKNVESLQSQDMQDFDIYIVDNASTDGSADELERTFVGYVEVIRNRNNLGGSGGFNTGMRYVMKRDYQYVVLLDNDVVLKENVIRQLYKDMSENLDIGIMGAKILKLDYPSIIQEFAPTLNYSMLAFELHYSGEMDTGELPHLMDCDYVPACALIVRREVIEKIGYLPEENFIYYDDIEWGVKCHRAGYRVVANSFATVWHKGGAMINPTTFGSYYLNRNKLLFFMTYMQTELPQSVTEEHREIRIEHILKDIYEGLYSCEQKNMINVAKTRMDALLDVLEGVVGKAKNYKIRQREIIEDKFDRMVKDSKNIRIYMNGLWETTRKIMNYIQVLETKMARRIEVELINGNSFETNEMLGIKIQQKAERADIEFDLVFGVCQHIYELDIKSYDGAKWVDGWKNLIFDKKDFEEYLRFQHGYRLFKLCFEDQIKVAMSRLEGDYKNE